MFNGENIPLDLNNPKNIWNINKFCENKSEYLEYHSAVAAAFKQDCENLLLAFEACKNLTFRAFAEIWQQSSFSLVFAGQEFFEELSMFAESCFFIIKKYLMFSPNINIQVGAFYLLYGIYSKQLSKDTVGIRITFEEYSALLKLVEVMQHDNAEDFIFIFKDLMYNQAFQFVSTTRCLGLEPKFTWLERKMKNDIFKNSVRKSIDKAPMKRLRNVLFSEDTYNLNNLDKICREYDEALKDYSASTSCKPLAIHSNSHVVQDVESLFHKLEGKLEKQPDYIRKENRAMAQRRAKLKAKAFREAKGYRNQSPTKE